jgi:hypothetical protein
MARMKIAGFRVEELMPKRCSMNPFRCFLCQRGMKCGSEVDNEWSDMNDRVMHNDFIRVIRISFLPLTKTQDGAWTPSKRSLHPWYRVCCCNLSSLYVSVDEETRNEPNGRGLEWEISCVFKGSGEFDVDLNAHCGVADARFCFLCGQFFL